MANCRNYNCEDLPEYDSDIEECGSNIRQAGASNIVLLECDHTITDASDGAAINAEIVAGRATLVENIKFGFDEPAAVNAPTKITSCGTVPVITFTRTATMEDYKVTKNNNAFWDAAKNRSFGGLIIQACSTSGLADVAFFVDAEVLITAFLNNGNDNELPMFYTVKFAWQDKDNPEMVDAPTGVFD